MAKNKKTVKVPVKATTKKTKGSPINPDSSGGSFPIKPVKPNK